MKDRIIKLMTSKKLTAIRFSEIMGVRPSSISHIMSGRNNPSYDFILKVLENFPDVSSDWFILGKGNMYRINGDKQPDLPFEGGIDDVVVNNDIIDPEEFNNGYEEGTEEDNTQMEKSVLKSDTVNPDKLNKRVERVVLLYSDGTFDSYNPLK